MNAKVAVLCWEESRPWVSSLRQNGYSVPWVEEPKGDAYKQIVKIEPDLIIVDLTRLPEQGRAMAATLAADEVLANVPIVVVSAKDSATRGLKGKVKRLFPTQPADMIAAVQAALAGQE